MPGRLGMTILLIAALGASVATAQPLTPITIQANPSGLQFTIDGGAAQTTPQTLNLLPGSYTIAVATPQVPPPFLFGTRVLFTSWSDGGAASHSITVGSSAATYTATFNQIQNELTISASPVAGGTVTPVSGGWYDQLTYVPIAAIANSGYGFASWSGVDLGGSASDPVNTAWMIGPVGLVANFLPLTATTIQTSPTGLQFTIDGGATHTAPRTLSLSQGSHTIAVMTPQAGTTGTISLHLVERWRRGVAFDHGGFVCGHLFGVVQDPVSVDDLQPLPGRAVRSHQQAEPFTTRARWCLLRLSPTAATRS